MKILTDNLEGRELFGQVGFSLTGWNLDIWVMIPRQMGEKNHCFPILFSTILSVLAGGAVKKP